ncbi:MAG TPA: DEAD/DEAH box helicase [Candidatus Methanoperedens sp.]|nr:DEAD/DEAH box helicase [Candidatus Methanoperedens sp.]
MSRIARFLERLARHADLASEVAHREEIPPRAARFGVFPSRLRPELRAGLAALGIERPWVHQAEAVRRALAGEDVVVVTPTASGKTLCYNLPVLDGCLAEPQARALYLFPIKALEQDQLGALRELAAACGLTGSITAEIYDGDTPAHRRAKIRATPPNVVISNPDMLHVGVLAFHPKWEAFFTNLRFIVLDEVHTYRGVFGSHVANLLRRLLRVAEIYGARPQIIACSATIANPGELAARLTGRAPAVVDESGAPEAGRSFLFVNPARRSPATLAAKLLREAVREDLATIVFTKSRKNTELVYTWAVHGDARLRKVVSAYRSGYLPEERREIEEKLFTGALKAVVSTSALEMGIDIGGLDVCILVGYPGSITATWQRGGRVGRQDRASLIVLLAGPDALDQYFMKHPEVFFASGFEPAVINPENLPVLASHLACAAAELPLRRDDAWFPRLGPGGGTAVADAIALLERSGELVRAVGEDCWHSVKRSPQRDVDIRGAGESYTIFAETAAVVPGARPELRVADRDRDETPPGRVVLLPPEEREPPLSPPAGRRRSRGSREEAPAPGAKPRVIGSLDGNRAFSEGHPGAIYLHRAAQYQVTRLDLDRRNLWARPVDVDYYTLPHREKETEILATRRSKLVHNFVCRLGELKVTERVVGYEKKRVSNGERLSVHELELPPSSFETIGLWIEIDEFVPRAVAGRRLNYMGGIHAVEHAAIALFPLFALCERDDVGGISTPLHAQVGKGAVFIYDGYAGGVGLAEASFSRIGELLERTLELIASCDCEGGCPACIYSNKCGNGNVPLDKEAAVTVLKLLLDHPDARAWREHADTGDEVESAQEPSPEPKPEPAFSAPRVMVLDVETLRSAEDVGGWHNSHLMGLAVAVVSDSATGESRAFFEHQAEELLAFLRQADLVVGFNIVGFDFKVLSAYDDGTLEHLPVFDILVDVRRRLGFRLSLAHLTEHTLGATKTGDGLQSLAWIREGRLDLVEEYCRSDVRITEQLFRHGLDAGYLRYLSRDGLLMELRVDWELEQLAPRRGG